MKFVSIVANKTLIFTRRDVRLCHDLLLLLRLTYVPYLYISLTFCIYLTDDFRRVEAHTGICRPQITLVAQLLLLITLHFFVIAELVIFALVENLTIEGSLDG